MRGIYGSKDTRLGAKIRKLRKERHMTQEKLAEKAEIDTSYLGQIERGERHSPGIAIIAKIAQALNVSEGELLSGEKESEFSTPSHAAVSEDIPERIADELRLMTPRQQRLYERVFRAIRELSESRD
ncbi:helix-turn-helix domain-containing protein [Saccharibacillus sp. O23]|uniref:helix-turn-helix domain-containing protein n=1 Tax=Saccharibacillus sp. O23 TaxID=2009338 RepID=UPI00211B4E66|nr:helix-turn-helix transcriptional regulator [Saccharibacillus sp. O23]